MAEYEYEYTIRRPIIRIFEYSNYSLQPWSGAILQKNILQPSEFKSVPSVRQYWSESSMALERIEQHCLPQKLKLSFFNRPHIGVFIMFRERLSNLSIDDCYFDQNYVRVS